MKKGSQSCARVNFYLSLYSSIYIHHHLYSREERVFKIRETSGVARVQPRAYCIVTNSRAHTRVHTCVSHVGTWARASYSSSARFVSP